MRGSFANGTIAEPPRIEGECAKAVGEGATEQVSVTTRKFFDEFEERLRKICKRSALSLARVGATLEIDGVEQLLL